MSCELKRFYYLFLLYILFFLPCILNSSVIIKLKKSYVDKKTQTFTQIHIYSYHFLFAISLFSLIHYYRSLIDFICLVDSSCIFD